eukprot:TRINITY_DN14246_c0_g1_i4.p1 TRINITY_DN14246_c0_g1~~TRINITY_DN14246_c0_g1_i4.p1  ORF type:complete len:4294 (+),score=1135.69 TRINITY_DN14246_c0_g1_i4:102-12983(+)
MKIEATLRESVPEAELTQVAACSRLAQGSADDIIDLLQQLGSTELPWERDRIEQSLWVPVLDRFDALLQTHVRQNGYSTTGFTAAAAVDTTVRQADQAASAAESTSVELIVLILRFTELLIFHCDRLRQIYASQDQIAALLEADDLRLVLAALRLLRMLVKRGSHSNSSVVVAEHQRKLLSLSAGWTPFEPRLSVLNACRATVEQCEQANDSSVCFEYRSAGSASGSRAGKPKVEHFEVPRSALLSPTCSLAALAEKLAQAHGLKPPPCRWELRCRLRAARAMATPEGRRRLAAVKVAALGLIMLPCMNNSGLGGGGMPPGPGATPVSNSVVSELIELLRYLPELDADVVEAVTSALGGVLHERSQQQKQLTLLLQLGGTQQANSGGGLVCSLVRAALSPEQPAVGAYSPAVVEGVLQFFWCCVSGNVGALGHSAVLQSLLDFTAKEEPEWHMAVSLAYRAIEALTDMGQGAPATLYRDLDGQGVFAQRLSAALAALSAHCDPEAAEALERTAGDSKQALAAALLARRKVTQLRLRCVLILRCVLAGLRAEATRGPGILRGPLAPLVKDMLSQAALVGFDCFAGAAGILAHLVGEDPACVTVLLEIGVIPAFLDTITKTPLLLSAPEVFEVVASVLGAVHLHEAGEKKVRDEYRPHPFQVLTTHLLVDPAAYRTLGGARSGYCHHLQEVHGGSGPAAGGGGGGASELYAVFGGTLDEVIQNRPSTRPNIVGFALAALQQFVARGRSYPKWTPLLKSPPPPQGGGASGGAGEAADKTEQYADRLAAMGRFLETFLAQGETVSNFAQRGGATLLIEALTMPCLPPLFLQLSPLRALFRAVGPVVMRDPSPSNSSTLVALGPPGPLAQLLTEGWAGRALTDNLPVDCTNICDALARLGSVLTVHAAGQREINSQLGLQAPMLVASAAAVRDVTPVVVWLFEQCSLLEERGGKKPPAETVYERETGGREAAAREKDASADYGALARNAYKDACSAASLAASTDASGDDPMGQSSVQAYPPAMVAEILWRSLFAVRQFIYSVARQLSLPLRRLHRPQLSSPPAALAGAARATGNALVDLWGKLLDASIPPKADLAELFATAAGAAASPEAAASAAAAVRIRRHLRYVKELLEFLHKSHVDEKHHHVRLLCVEGLHKAGYFGTPNKSGGQHESPPGALHDIARFVLESMRFAARHEANKDSSGGIQELAQNCFGALARYFERLTSSRAILTAPTFPLAAATPASTSGQVASGGGDAQPVLVARLAVATALLTAGGGNGDAAQGTAALTGWPTEAAAPAVMAGAVDGASAAGNSAAGTSMDVDAGAAEEAADPWRLWTHFVSASCDSLLQFWTEEDPLVVKSYKSKAVQLMLRTFYNSQVTMQMEGFPAASVSRVAFPARAPSTYLPVPPTVSATPAASSGERAVQGMVDMGVARHRAEVALWHSGNAIEQAMEWLVSHPEEASAASTSPADGTAAKMPAETILVQARVRLRSCLLPRLPFIGAHVGGTDSSLIQACARLAQLSWPIGEATDFAERSATSTRLVNARAIYATMVNEVHRLAEAYPETHPVWEPGFDHRAPLTPDGSEEKSPDVAAAFSSGGLAFAFWLISIMLHKRPLASAVAAEQGPGGLVRLVETGAELLRRAAARREATLPTNWTQAFAQGHDFLFGNLALPTPTLERLAAETAPPKWAEACLVMMHEAVQNLWLAAVPPSLASALPASEEAPRLREETQGALVTVVLDMLTLFPKQEGTFAMAGLFLLRELCSVSVCAGKLAGYHRSAGLILEAPNKVLPAEGGGLAAILRLPRHARCAGYLRLVSDICSQVFEDDNVRAQQIEEQTQKLFNSSETVEFRDLVERLQPWIRSCPEIVEEVLKGLCYVRIAQETGSGGEPTATPKVEFSLVPEGERNHYRPGKGDARLPQQQVVQKLLEHLLWTMSLERSYEKHSETNNTDASSVPPQDCPKCFLPYQMPWNVKYCGHCGTKRAGVQNEKSQGSWHPLALPADSVLYVLQNALGNAPPSTWPSHGKAASSTPAGTADGLQQGKWSPMPEKPAELPEKGTHLAGRPLHGCAAKSPCAFLLRRLLGGSFFLTEPSPTTLSTVHKAIAVIGLMTSRQAEVRTKVLSEVISLLKQLATQVEANGAAPPGGGTPRKGASAASSSADVTMAKESTEQGVSPAAFTSGLGYLCDLLETSVRNAPGSPGSSTTTQAPSLHTLPAAEQTTTGTMTGVVALSPAGLPAPATPPATLGLAPATPSSSTLALSGAEARSLRAVLCRLLAAVNLYCVDATAVAGRVVRCLELLTRPELLTSPKSVSGASGSGSKAAGSSCSVAASGENGMLLHSDISMLPEGRQAAQEASLPAQRRQRARGWQRRPARQQQLAISSSMSAFLGALETVADQVNAMQSSSDDSSSSSDSGAAEPERYNGNEDIVMGVEEAAAADGNAEQLEADAVMPATPPGSLLPPDDREDAAEEEDYDEDAEEEEDEDGGDEDGMEGLEEHAPDWAEDAEQWDEGAESEDEGEGHNTNEAEHFSAEDGPFLVDLRVDGQQVIGRDGRARPRSAPPTGATLFTPGHTAESGEEFSFGRHVRAGGARGVFIASSSGGPPVMRHTADGSARDWMARCGGSAHYWANWGWDGELELPPSHPMLFSTGSQNSGNNYPPSFAGTSQIASGSGGAIGDTAGNASPSPVGSVTGSGGAGEEAAAGAGAAPSCEGSSLPGGHRIDEALAVHLAAVLMPAPPRAPPVLVPPPGTSATQPATWDVPVPETPVGAPLPPLPPSPTGSAAGAEAGSAENTAEAAAPSTANEVFAAVEGAAEAPATPIAAGAAEAEGAAPAQGQGEASAGPAGSVAPQTSAPMAVDSPGASPQADNSTGTAAEATMDVAAAAVSTTDPALEAAAHSTAESVAPMEVDASAAVAAQAPIDYGVEALRRLAVSLNVRQQVLAEIAGIDTHFLEGLPVDLREEAIRPQLATLEGMGTEALQTAIAARIPAQGNSGDSSSTVVAAPTDAGASSDAQAPPTTDSAAAAPPAADSGLIPPDIDPDVFDALPPDIREEILAEQARELAAAEAAAARAAAPPDTSMAEEMDNASFIATLTPELRAEVLLTVTDDVIRTLPPELVAEAQLVRERTFHRSQRQRFAAELEVPPAQVASPPAAPPPGGLALGADGQWRPLRGTITVQMTPSRPPGRVGAAQLQPAGARQPVLSRSGSWDIRGSVGLMLQEKVVARFDDASAELPIDPQHAVTFCRLLFLRKQPPKIHLERLMFNVAAHPTTREALMQRFLQILVGPDNKKAVGNSSSSGDSSSSSVLADFPPRQLYGPWDLGLASEASETAACEVAGGHVLKHLAFLLQRIPQAAGFFAKRMSQKQDFEIEEPKRKKRKVDVADAPTPMEVSGADEVSADADVAINVLIKHTGPDKLSARAAGAHTQLWIVLRMLLLHQPAPPPDAPGVEPLLGAAPQCPHIWTNPIPLEALPAVGAASSSGPAATAADAAVAAAAAAATAAATAAAAAAAATTAAAAATTAAAAATTAAAAATASAPAVTLSPACPGRHQTAAQSWASKLQALLNSESAATLCAHLCRGGAGGVAEPRAEPIIATILKGPCSESIKAKIYSELLDHLQSIVGRVVLAIKATSETNFVNLQVAGREVEFLELLRTLRPLMEDLPAAGAAACEGGVTASASSSTAPPHQQEEVAPALAPASPSSLVAPGPRDEKFQRLLQEAGVSRVWNALDTALAKAEQTAAVDEESAQQGDGEQRRRGDGRAVGQLHGNQAKPTTSPLLQSLLPLVEAFFLAHEKVRPPPPGYPPPPPRGDSAAAPGVPAAASPTLPLGFPPSPLPPGSPLTMLDRATQGHSLVEDEPAPSETEGGSSSSSRRELAAFGERHRRCVNALVRQAPSLLSGTFAPLVELVPWCLDFENKRHYLRQRLRQLRGEMRYDVMRLHLRRDQVFLDSYHQLRIRSGEEMRGKLSISFVGEEAMDAGGVQREWYKILSREIFNPNYALFHQAGGKACTFHPNKMSYVNPDHLSFFRFIGRIIGKALFDGQHLEAYFSRSFYKHMLRRKVNTSDMEALDPDYYRNLRWMLDNSIEGVLGHLTFTAESEEFGKVKTVELKPNGRSIPVTDENKREYVQLMCEHKMTKSVSKQINAFLEGFHELIPPQLISIFDDKELELLISGLPDIDMEDLHHNTEYHNYTEASPQIQWFWKVMSELTKEQKGWFLMFVTGTSQVPLEGFKGLIGMRGPQKFSIHRAEGGDRLPSAHTCFNQLDLPEYESEDQLRRKVVQAINEAHEGFGFV